MLVLCALMVSFLGVPLTSASFFIMLAACVPFLGDAAVNVSHLFGGSNQIAADGSSGDQDF